MACMGLPENRKVSYRPYLRFWRAERRIQIINSVHAVTTRGGKATVRATGYYRVEATRHG